MFAARCTKHPISMWLIVPIVVLVILAILGGVLVSGIFAVVLLPIAAIVLLVGLVTIWRRASDPEFQEHLDEKERKPLGASGGMVDASSTAPSTPDELVNARRSSH